MYVFILRASLQLTPPASVPECPPKLTRLGISLKDSDVIWKEFQGNYMWIWWNDVDYALILAALVIGPRSYFPIKQLFKTFDRLRKTELTGPRQGRCATATAAGAGMSELGTFVSMASAGILAPVALPLMAAGTATFAFSSLIKSSISSGERGKQQRRDEACRRLIQHYPQLEAVLERGSCS